MSIRDEIQKRNIQIEKNQKDDKKSCTVFYVDFKIKTLLSVENTIENLEESDETKDIFR